MEVAKVQVVREPPTSGLAGQLLKRYYTELAVRFPDGFDPELAGRVPVEDLVPPNGTFLVVRVNSPPGRLRSDAQTERGHCRAKAHVGRSLHSRLRRGVQTS